MADNVFQRYLLIGLGCNGWCRKGLRVQVDLLILLVMFVIHGVQRTIGNVLGIMPVPGAPVHLFAATLVGRAVAIYAPAVLCHPEPREELQTKITRYINSYY